MHEHVHGTRLEPHRSFALQEQIQGGIGYPLANLDSGVDFGRAPKEVRRS
jgi:hypothetical protein